jgi:ferrous iron transport protein B
MNLAQLKEGESGIIAKVRGRGGFRRRIMEMGFVKNQKVKVVKKAPLRDPIEYNIMGYQVSLRKNEAELIELQEVNLKERAESFYNGITESKELFQEKLENKAKKINIALVGNPNSGKTTVFNYLTGMHERVGNYSGVTVDVKTAKIKYNSYLFNLTDLPGTYSITSYSPEELFVRERILDDLPDVVVNVVDSSNLERNLYLTTQLIDMDIKVILVFNMFDELEKNNEHIDVEVLSKMLGMPIIPTVAKNGRGIKKIKDTIIEVFEDKSKQLRHIHINYGSVLEDSIKKVQEKIKIPKNYFLTDKISSRYLAIKLLEADEDAISRVKVLENYEEIELVYLEEEEKIEKSFNDDSETAFTDAKYGFINGALKETYKANDKIDKQQRTRFIDSFITDKLYGFPIFVLFMWVMFQSTFFIGAYPQVWLENGVSVLGNFVSSFMPESIFRDLLIDGIIGGVGGVIVFLPNILILFFFISLMEDTGYMARVAFIVDKIMHRVGLHGRSFVPLLMGFGCNVPAIMATRTIENRNDRLVTMLINPFMSCSARLPVYVLIISAVFPKYPGTMLFAMYSIGIITAGLVAWVFKKTLFKSKEMPFVMELPPYRMPSMKSTVKHMWFKTYLFLKKMAGVILIASVIIWALGYFPRNLEYSQDYQSKIELAEQKLESVEKEGAETKSLKEVELNNEIKDLKLSMRQEEQEKSLIGIMGKGIEPVIRPLGFDWKMGVSLVTGMLAKEIVVSTMGVLYNTDNQEDVQPLAEKLQQAKYESGSRKGEFIYTPLVGFGFMIFILFYVPCVATIAAIRRESGAWKYALFSVAYSTVLAYVAALLVYQIGSLFV